MSWWDVLCRFFRRLGRTPPGSPTDSPPPYASDPPKVDSPPAYAPAHAGLTLVSLVPFAPVALVAPVAPVVPPAQESPGSGSDSTPTSAESAPSNAATRRERAAHRFLVKLLTQRRPKTQPSSPDEAPSTQREAERASRAADAGEADRSLTAGAGLTQDKDSAPTALGNADRTMARSQEQADEAQQRADDETLYDETIKKYFEDDLAIVAFRLGRKDLAPYHADRTVGREVFFALQAAIDRQEWRNKHTLNNAQLSSVTMLVAERKIRLRDAAISDRLKVEARLTLTDFGMGISSDYGYLVGVDYEFS